MRNFVFLLLMISVLAGCRKSLTVEETAQRWVEYYYNSEFDKAKLLSTQITKNLIDTIAIELLEEDDIIDFKIIQMNCEVNGDSAVCTYIYKDDIGEVEEQVHLIKLKNKWLVDEPLSGETLTDEEMEQIFMEYEEMLKEEQQTKLENDESSE